MPGSKLSADSDLRAWFAGALAGHYRGLGALHRKAWARSPGPWWMPELILPVLDGFDEIGAAAHTDLLRQIHGCGQLPFVLTSLPDPYMAAVRTAGPVSGAAVVTLEDLTTDDLTGYLPRIPGVAGRRWSAVLDQARQAPDAPGCAAVRSAPATPLITGLARTVYSGDRDPHVLLDVRRFGSAAVLEQHLLDQWVDDVYRTGSQEPGGTTGPGGAARRRGRLRQHRAELAIHRLGFLAHSGQDFGWWALAPVAAAGNAFGSALSSWGRGEGGRFRRRAIGLASEAEAEARAEEPSPSSAR
ncbi:hypothetical protein ACIPYQ_28365 [Streptomyces sp. NPDC090045]|uniref:hypothetical protein n=1 Tax=Streptomyces sp. NPDC090045 TaxID=3365927 RepID=UPI0038007BE3